MNYFTFAYEYGVINIDYESVKIKKNSLEEYLIRLFLY